MLLNQRASLLFHFLGDDGAWQSWGEREDVFVLAGFQLLFLEEFMLDEHYHLFYL